jgi:hypothetical protein
MLPLVGESPPKGLKIGGVQFRPSPVQSICIFRIMDSIFLDGDDHRCLFGITNNHLVLHNRLSPFA